MYLTRSVERTTNLNNLYRRSPALARVLSNSPPPAIILACKSGASSARKLYRPYLSCYAAWNNIKHEGANNKSLRPCVEIWTGVRLSRSLHNIFFRPTRQAHTTRTRQWKSDPTKSPKSYTLYFCITRIVEAIEENTDILAYRAGMVHQPEGVWSPRSIAAHLSLKTNTQLPSPGKTSLW